MTKLYLINVLFLLITSVSVGQNSNSVEILVGRGEFNNAQIILDLSHQNLNKFPMRALDPEIEILILDNNRITKLPSWIGQLKKLKVLSLRNNSFKELDYWINSCENLEQLYLSGNKELSDISSLFSTSKLKIIDVIDTKINSVPSCVRLMDDLFYFKYTKKEDKN